MSEPKFTKGPWRFTRVGIRGEVPGCHMDVLLSDTTQNAVAHKKFFLCYSPGAIDCEFVPARSFGIIEADANLITAATDLYEALSNIENDDGSIPPAIWKIRNAALAKARGEA